MQRTSKETGHVRARPSGCFIYQGGGCCTGHATWFTGFLVVDYLGFSNLLEWEKRVLLNELTD